MAKSKQAVLIASPDGAEAPVARSRNILLAQVPESELGAFLARTEPVTFRLRQELFEQGDPIELAWFPLTGMGSLVTVLRDGTFLEALNVGREGFIGTPLINGVRTHQTKGICQIAGDFLQIGAADLLRAIDGAPSLSAILRRYTQYAHEAVVQSAACNSVHLLEQRCARWLLMTADAVGDQTFSLTQEFLSQMLAVRRAGVTVAIGALERRGLVTHRYGEVSITDVKGLRDASCECYSTMRVKAQDLLKLD